MTSNGESGCPSQPINSAKIFSRPKGGLETNRSWTEYSRRENAVKEVNRSLVDLLLPCRPFVQAIPKFRARIASLHIYCPGRPAVMNIPQSTNLGASTRLLRNEATRDPFSPPKNGMVWVIMHSHVHSLELSNSRKNSLADVA